MYNDESGFQRLLRELAETFGNERLLTDPEDIYVYSRFGRFGTKRVQPPLAVVRLKTREEGKRLQEIAEKNSMQIINRAEYLDFLIEDGSKGALILDSNEFVTVESLTENLLELKRVDTIGRQDLKNAASFPQWFVSSMKRKTGYRVDEHASCDNGFCIVQPFFDGVETFSSKGRLLLSRGLFEGEIKPTKKLVDSMYTCTACGQCFNQLTLGGFEINNAIVRARHEIVKMGAGPGQCKVLSESIQENGNPMGMPAEDRPLWFDELVQEFPFKGEGFLYWTGCSTAYRLPHIVESTANIMNKAEVYFGLLGEDEGCCGLILYLLGLWEEAVRNGYRIVRKLEELGVRKMVTSCAGCYFAFTRAYQMLGVEVPFKVLHTSQLIESLISDERLHFKKKGGTFVWHDPCDLGRHCKVFDPPRKVLGSIPELELKEQILNKEHAVCCGAGGGLWMYDKDLAEKIADSKIKGEIEPLRVDGVITGCPNCILSLKYASAEMDLNIFDISEIVDICL